MKFLQFTQLLAVPMTVLLGSAASTYISTTSCITTVEATTTSTTTVLTTVTQTSTVFETKTREAPCPASETGVLDFDDLSTSGVSPMPLIYKDFAFSGSAGWLYYIYSAFAPTSLEYLSVNSRPNALLSRSYGLVSFSSKDRGFSFDITSLSFSAFTWDVTSNDNSILTIQVKLTSADGYINTLFFEHPNGALNGTKPEVLGADDLAAQGFTDLVDVAVAAWKNYDNTTGTGYPAYMVIDDIEYVKRKCGYY